MQPFRRVSFLNKALCVKKIPMSLRMASGFFYFRIFPKRFFSVRLVNSSMMCYNKKGEQIFVIIKNICLPLEVGVWKERIYAVI